ncbi:MAG TPA: acyltransferase [Anaerolineales bacterium]|nr:acyltransferase [Anaerolineales bacterium]
MSKKWKTETGLSRDEFEKFTVYLHQSDNDVDNRNRSRILGFDPEHVEIAPGACIRLSEDSIIGKNCFIGLFAYINGDVVIHDNVLIGPHCSITSNNHIFETETKHFSGNKGEKIEVGEGTWVAAGCMITAGVTVGRANLICANAVVTKDTPDYAIIAGTPARQVGRINPETGEYHWYPSKL